MNSKSEITAMGFSCTIRQNMFQACFSTVGSFGSEARKVAGMSRTLFVYSRLMKKCSWTSPVFLRRNSATRPPQ